MQLFLTNNLDKKVYSFVVYDDNSSKLYYHVGLVIYDMPDGEYTYELKEGDVVLGRGLCQLGDYVPVKTTYIQNKNNGYIQYE